MSELTFSSSPSSPQIGVYIDAFEYGCCRKPPRIGDTVRGRLTAHPSPTGPESGTRWDRECDVVGVGEAFARWDPGHGDPCGQPMLLTLSWHENAPGGVEATGVVATVEQLYYEASPAPGQSPRELRRSVDAADRFATDIVADDGAEFGAGGVYVVLDDLELTAPTPADAANARAAADRGRRTLTIVGPAPCFGPTVPAEGGRVRVDLDDPRLNISGVLADVGGVVAGTAGQVGRVESAGLFGVIVPVPIRPGDLPLDATAELLVVMVVDPGHEQAARLG
ncbi:hypothetical protein [Gordonia sp. NB41Y]|uniref:hypothetical protein n=1 Tax=Gordonia sp. NB41Y TaxID=875808 RepID=UPI0002BE5132|nr:hypothetical protein [Gordonia sp. NB41Y]WLP90732.1 hypothetical protein Q9K23_00025 [Gordonia sp. NB41Y]